MKPNIVSLTLEEKDFAGKNHNLIYDFLHFKNYSFDEFYDVVVFGYLNAVRSYFRVEKLRNFKFSTVAYQNMQGEISHYFTGLKRKKNIPFTSSLDEEINEGEDYTLHGIMCCGESDFEEVESTVYIDSLLANCPKNQREVMLLMIQGYNITEIAKILSLSHQAISQRRAAAIENIKKALTPIAVGVSA